MASDVRTPFTYADVNLEEMAVQMSANRDLVRISVEAPPYGGTAVRHYDVNQVRMLAARLSALADQMEEYF